MGAGKAAARRRLRARDDGADREIQPRHIRSTKMAQQQQQRRRGRPASGSELTNNNKNNYTSASPTTLLAEAESLLRQARASDALPIALHALDVLNPAATTDQDSTPPPPPHLTSLLPLLNLVAETYIELGDLPSARSYFQRAVTLDPDGSLPCAESGGGAEKFLWLAQLSEEGGQESVEWFARGAGVLRREIGALEGGEGGQKEEEEEEEEESKRKKLAGALCAMVEVYMTDLSWEPSAETECERLVAEALLVAPGCAEVLQTLASVRISQVRIAEAREALRDSVAVWRDLGREDGAVPDFATRVSLARLLMEVGMEEEAVGVVERLVLEDDGCVEAWYLGGWCLYLLGVKQRERKQGEWEVMDGVNGDEGKEEEEEDLYIQSMVSSREWLRQSLKLYEMVEYEDEKLRDHAMELVGELDAIIGEEDEVDGGEEEEWDGFGEESEEEQEDEEMDEG